LRTAQFTFSAVETGSGLKRFECSLDGATYADCTTPKDYNTLGDGGHTFDVRAVDNANNVGAAVRHSWTVDGTAPVTTIVQKPPSLTNSRTAQFTFSAVETGSGLKEYQCSLDGAAYTVCESPKTYNTLGDGDHTFDVLAVDNANNVGPVSRHAWKVDGTAPVSAIGTKPRNPTNSTSAMFTFSATDANAVVRFMCQRDGLVAEECTVGTITYNALAPGDHTFKVWAEDAAGNEESPGASYLWTVDTGDPETTIVSGPPQYSKTTTATFVFTSNESSAGFECRLNSSDENDFRSCTSPHSFTVTANLAHILDIRAKDPAGNVDGTPERYSWTVDTIEPTTSITNSPPVRTNSTSVSFTFSSNETRVTYECRLDSTLEADFVSCPSPYTVSVTTDGNHSLDVRARDAAGNVDSSPESHRWTLDRVAPVTSLTGKPSPATSSNTATFTFSSNEPSKFRCQWDTSQPLEDCQSPIELLGLPDGTRWFEVYAVDLSGNADGSPERYTWVIDTRAPIPKILTKPPSQSNATAATFTFTFESPPDDNELVTYECELDGVNEPGCTSPKNYTVGQGSHTFTVRVIDEVGNEDPAGASYTWNVDLEAPIKPVIETPEEGEYVNRNQLLVTGQAEALSKVTVFIDGVKAGTVESTGTWALTVDLSTVADGIRQLTAEAVDVSGNSSGKSDPRSFKLDRIPPVVTITDGPPPIGKQNTGVTFRFTANEPVRRYECSENGAPFGECTSPHVLPDLQDGRYDFYVRAVDLARNVGVPAKHSWTIDLKPPVVRIDSPKPNEVVNARRPVVSGVAEPFVKIDVFIDNVRVGGTSTSVGDPVTGLAVWTLTSSTAFSNEDVPHFVRAQATDLADNVASVEQRFFIDTNPPDTVIDSGPPNPHNTKWASFEVSSPNGGEVFECNLDETGFSDCGAEEVTCTEQEPKGCKAVFDINLAVKGKRVVAGQHQMRIRARDEGGNFDPDPAIHNWIVIITPPPPPTITEPTPDGVLVETLVIRGTATYDGQVEFYEGPRNESGSNILGSAPVEGGEWEFTRVLEEGTHTVYAYGTDIAENTGEPASVTFSVVPRKPQGRPEGGGLACAASSPQPWLALLGLIAAAVWNSRKQRR
jgi:hypothetical protein